MDWSLYRCGRVGHITYAPDERHLREQMHSSTASTELWQCLRCGSYVTGEPHGTGPSADAPAVRRGKQIRGDLILKLFAIERGIRFIIFGAVAYGIWRFASSRTIAQAINKDIPIIQTLSKQLGFTLSHSLLEKLRSLLHISSSNLRLLALGVTALALVSAIEAFALWQAKRWGEYFAMIVTSLGLPFEIYELFKAVTATKITLFVLNLLLVFYLVYSRRLFGARGGKEAYEARLRAESTLDAAEKAAAALSAGRTASASSPASAGSPADEGGPESSGVTNSGVTSSGVTVPMATGPAAVQPGSPPSREPDAL